MFVEFKFWKHLLNQNNLIASMEEHTTMRNFEKRVWLVALFGVILYALQDIWGMNTEGLTTIFVAGDEATYSIARIMSVIGAIIVSIIFMAFHFFGMSYILHKITKIELSKAAVMQLFVVALLLMEKALLFGVFSVLGYTTAFSFLSFGPLAATFLHNEFFIFFFDQLTIITGLIIAVQFKFLRAFTTMSSRTILLVLIAIPIIFALIIAGVSVLPVEAWIEGGQAV